MAGGPLTKMAWSQEQDDVILAGRTGDVRRSYTAIAAELGRGAATIFERAKVLGIEIKARPAYKPKAAVERKPTAGNRLCLGHCGLHFRSPDPARIRLCDNCKRTDANGLPAGWL